MASLPDWRDCRASKNGHTPMSDRPLPVTRHLSRRTLLGGLIPALSLAACSRRDETAEPLLDRFSVGEGAYRPVGTLQDIPPSTGPFTARFAPHFGMFEGLAGPDFVDQLKFAHDQGFRAWEDNSMAVRPLADQIRLGNAMRELGIELGVFVLGDRQGWQRPTLTSGDAQARRNFMAQVDNAIGVAERTGATRMTVLPGLATPGLRRQYQMAHIVDALREACDRIAPHGLTMVVEPINNVDFPGVFLNRTPDGYLISKAVDRPECKLLFDIYHQQIMDGNIIRDMDACWSEIAYFQLGDHPGRNKPHTGETNYANVLQHVWKKGYRGVLGMEHGVTSTDPAAEEDLILTYRRLDGLLKSI